MRVQLTLVNCECHQFSVWTQKNLTVVHQLSTLISLNRQFWQAFCYLCPHVNTHTHAHAHSIFCPRILSSTIKWIFVRLKSAHSLRKRHAQIVLAIACPGQIFHKVMFELFDLPRVSVTTISRAAALNPSLLSLLITIIIIMKVIMESYQEGGWNDK